ncbi:MAG: TetR/AcrR family transcriptional regulator [Acidimicrobiales bacterium]
MGARAYLRSDDRRRQLLDAASRLFDRGGLTAITMSAVAAEAGASRRLVYDHFADLPALYEAFFDDRVARYAAAIDAASAAAADGRGRSIAGAVTALMAIPAEDLRAIHLLLADHATPELAGARDALRAHLQARWLPALAALAVEAEVAGALLWTLASSFVTLAELAHRGELDPAAAEALASAMVAGLPDLVARLALQPTTAPEPS